MQKHSLHTPSSLYPQAIIHGLDDTEALLGSIYVSNTGRPNYPLLTLFRSLLLDIECRLFGVQLARALHRGLFFCKFCRYQYY